MKKSSEVSFDLRAEFPEARGFSPRNLKYMRAFSDAWRREEIVQAPLAQLPWYHQIALMERLKSRTDRLAYAALAVENGWSRNVLVHHVELGTASRPDGRNSALTNFGRTLPPADSDLADGMLKGKYDLGFLEVSRRINVEVLGGKRAAYGKKVVGGLAEGLVREFGDGWNAKQLHRMMQFATEFPDERIVASLIRQLSWSHILALIPIDDPLKRDFCAEMCKVEQKQPSTRWPFGIGFRNAT